MDLFDTAESMLRLLVDHAEKADFAIPVVEIKLQLLAVHVYNCKKLEAGLLADNLLRSDFRSPMSPENVKVGECIEALSGLLQNKARGAQSPPAGLSTPGKSNSDVGSLLLAKLNSRRAAFEAAWGQSAGPILRCDFKISLLMYSLCRNLQ